jgi:hypothetical protein
MMSTPLSVRTPSEYTITLRTHSAVQGLSYTPGSPLRLGPVVRAGGEDTQDLLLPPRRWSEEGHAVQGLWPPSLSLGQEMPNGHY